MVLLRAEICATIVGVVVVRELGGVAFVEQSIGILQSLVVAFELGKVEKCQTVETRMTWISRETEHSNFESLVVLLQIERRHRIVVEGVFIHVSFADKIIEF